MCVDLPAFIVRDFGQTIALRNCAPLLERYLKMMVDVVLIGLSWPGLNQNNLMCTFVTKIEQDGVGTQMRNMDQGKTL